jgi:hypothetical protein
MTGSTTLHSHLVFVVGGSRLLLIITIHNKAAPSSLFVVYRTACLFLLFVLKTSFSKEKRE